MTPNLVCIFQHHPHCRFLFLNGYSVCFPGVMGFFFSFSCVKASFLRSVVCLFVCFIVPLSFFFCFFSYIFLLVLEYLFHFVILFFLAFSSDVTGVGPASNAISRVTSGLMYNIRLHLRYPFPSPIAIFFTLLLTSVSLTCLQEYRCHRTLFSKSKLEHQSRRRLIALRRCRAGAHRTFVLL